MGQRNEKRDEWVRLMLELADLDREEYRAARANAWRRVERSHAEKTPEQRARWVARSS